MALLPPIVSTSAGSSGGGAVTTSGIDTSGANFLAVVVAGYKGVNAIAGTLNDNKSNTWSLAIEADVGGSFTDYGVYIYYVENAIVGSGHTFTVGAASTFCSIYPAAYAGIRLSGSLDVTSFANTGNTAAASVNVTSTPTVSNQLIVA